MSKERNLPSKPCPWLVHTYGRYLKNQLFCSLSHPHTIYRKRIPMLSADSHIVAYSHGWFLLSQKKDTHLSLWNPTISHDDSSFIRLPPLFLKSTHKITHYFLSSPPHENPDSMVLLFDETLYSLFCIRPSHPHKQWVKIPYADLAPRFVSHDPDSLQGCVSCNGKLYSFTLVGHKLVTLNVDKNDRLSIHELCELPWRNPLNAVGLSLPIMFKNNLIECCGELLYVYIRYVESKMKQVVIEVSVFKLDFDKMIWESAHNLMGQAVFFNGLGDSWCPIFGFGMREADSLYFTLPNNKSLYSFNVKDGCLSVNLPRPNLPPSCSSPKILVPDHVRLCNNEEIDEKDNNTIVEIQTQEIPLSDLPSGIIMEIANCLNLFDYLNFHAVCRDYRFIVPKLKRKQALQRFKTCLSSSSIWLLLPANDMTALKFVDPVHGTSFLMNLPESLKGSIVRYSRNGWLLMCNQQALMSFFNPFTEEIIKLQDPPTHLLAASYAMVFSSSPTSSDCITLGCFAFPPIDSTSELCVLVSSMGIDKQWLDADLEVDESIFWLSNNSPLFYEGCFYLLEQQGNFSVLEYEEEETDMEEIVKKLRWVVLTEPKEPCKYYQDNFLVECDGKLMSIFVGQMGKWVKVFSLNFDTMCWEKVRSLGKYVIYVSSLSCISKEAIIQGTENRIYFPRFCGNSMVFYSLETRKFHADGEGTVESFYGTKEPLVATWIEPMY